MQPYKKSVILFVDCLFLYPGSSKPFLPNKRKQFTPDQREFSQPYSREKFTRFRIQENKS